MTLKPRRRRAVMRHPLHSLPRELSSKAYLDERLKLREGLHVLRGALIELAREILVEDVLRLRRD